MVDFDQMNRQEHKILQTVMGSCNNQIKNILAAQEGESDQGSQHHPSTLH